MAEIKCRNCGDQELKEYLAIGAKHRAVKRNDGNDFQGYHVQCKNCNSIELLVPSKFTSPEEFNKTVKTLVDAQKAKPSKKKKG